MSWCCTPRGSRRCAGASGLPARCAEPAHSWRKDSQPWPKSGAGTAHFPACLCSQMNVMLACNKAQELHPIAHDISRAWSTSFHQPPQSSSPWPSTPIRQQLHLQLKCKVKSWCYMLSGHLQSGYLSLLGSQCIKSMQLLSGRPCFEGSA